MVLFTILKDYIICVNDICNHTDLINSSLYIQELFDSTEEPRNAVKTYTL